MAVAGITRILGGADKAVELYRRVTALDPLSSAAHRTLGLRLYLMGRLDEAAVTLQTARELNPNAGLVHCFLAVTRLAQGRPAEALALAEQERLPVFRLMGLGIVQHDIGNRAASDDALHQLAQDYGTEAAYQVAILHVCRGEYEPAFDWLERAYAQRDPGVVNTAFDPHFKPMHADPRWVAFMRKMGLAWPIIDRKDFPEPR
jgi:tetratricopeptide (TPR) repeat protein